LCESRELDDVIVGEQEVRKQEDAANATSTPDVGSDQPASTKETRSEEVQPTKPSLQEVLEDTTGLGSDGQAVGSGIPTSANDREEPTVRENERAQFNPDIEWLDVSIDETIPTLPSASIDCPTQGDPGPSNAIFQSSPEGRQRPARNAHRPPRYRDNSFETQFQPVPRRRNCRKIQKRNPTGYDVTNVGEYQDLGRGENRKCHPDRK